MKKAITNIHFINLTALACFPLFSMQFVVILIATFSAISLLLALTNKSFSHLKETKEEFLIWILPFLLILLSCLNEGSKASFFYLERSVSLIVFPFVFFILPFRYSLKHQTIILGSFIASTLVFVTWGIVKVLLEFGDKIANDPYYYNATDVAIKNNRIAYNFRTSFISITDLHPSYASIFIGVCILIILYSLIQKHSTFSNTKTTLYVLLIITFLSYQAILAARMPFISTFIASFILYILNKKSLKSILFAVTTIIIAGLILTQSPTMQGRLRKVSFSDLKVPTATSSVNSINTRAGIIMCSVEIIKTNWLFGVGPGKVQQKLNDCYCSLPTESYEGRNFNTHNQWLDYFCGMGILGPISLFLLILQFIKKNLALNLYLPIAIVIFFSICFLTENVLIRQHGVVIFSFFLSFFSFHSKEKKLFRFL